MTTSDLLPLLAALAFVAFAARAALAPDRPTAPWWAPAALSVAFLAFSLHAMASTGPLGFWTEHTRNAWGNQIWFDLLLAIGIAWTLILPEARALGMRPLPWLALVLATGCIGLLAMLARLTWLREHAGRPAASPTRRPIDVDAATGP